jgi:pimeloyl-ACP methyl ester carboxylesterase
MQKLAEALASRTTDVPALLIWGDRDPVVPAFTARELMRHLVHSEQVTLPGVGHLPNDERPEECAKLIRTWLMRGQTDRSEPIVSSGHGFSRAEKNHITTGL